MQERTTENLLDALKRALMTPGEQRLYRSGKLDGLFASRLGASAEAASFALREGLLEVVRKEIRGKSEFEWVQLTPRGIEYIHDQESPVATLRGLQADLACGQRAIPLWLEQMRATLRNLEQALTNEASRWSERLDGLARQVNDTLHRLEAAAPMLPPEVAGAHPWAIDALNYLDRRRNAGSSEPCPFPELFRALQGPHPDLGLSSFQEGMRRLKQCQAIALQPAEDLTTLPQPEYALLEGGSVLYYASR